MTELQLRQGLDVAEIAAVLGVSPQPRPRAAVPGPRSSWKSPRRAARGPVGRQDCAALNTMLADWDGQLNVLMRKRINRHIENCPACTERTKRELAPALLLGLAPLAALPGAVPPGLREQVLRLASSNTPDAAALPGQRGAAHRAVSGSTGSPSHWTRRSRRGGGAAPGRPRRRLPRRRWSPRSRCWPWRWRPQGRAIRGRARRAGPGIGSGNEHRGGRRDAGRARQRGFQQPAAAHRVRERRGERVPGGRRCAAARRGRRRYRRARGQPPAPARRVIAGPVAPGLGAAVQLERQAEFARPDQQRHGDRQFVAEPGRPATVTPTTIVLGLNGGTLTLKASFGSVDWSVTESSSLIGQVTVSPTAGTLASGQSATVSVSAGSLLGGLHAAALAGGRRGRVRGLHTHREPGRHHGHGRAGHQPAAIQPAAIQPAAITPLSSPPPSSPPPDAATIAALAARLLN